MPSSTSNSEPEADDRSSGGLLVAGKLLVRTAGPGVLVATLIAAALTFVVRKPRPPTITIEDVILEAQMKRAESIEAPETLFVGDSSCLMGIDPLALGDYLGEHVQSLAMIGYVGPAGMAAVLDRLAAREQAPSRLVLVINPATLALRDKDMVDWERRLTSWDAPPQNPFLRARDAVYSATLSPVVQLPLPGSFGRSYGWPEGLARAIDEGRGGVVDPSSFDACVTPNREIHPAVKQRLPVLAAAVERIGAKQAYVVLSPSPEECSGNGFDRAASTMTDELAAALGVPALDVSPVLPKRVFSTRAHLSREGRALFTRDVANALRTRSSP